MPQTLRRHRTAGPTVIEDVAVPPGLLRPMLDPLNILNSGRAF
jgi:hypothetical protein